MEEHAHHAMGPGMMELIQLVNLAVVILILYFGTRKAITATVQARSEGIAKKLTESKRELEKVQGEIEGAKREFEKIEDMKKEIFSQMREEGQKLATHILADAKNVADRILADARIAAEDESRVAVMRLREQVVAEAIKKSTMMLTESSKSASGDKVHEKMVDKFISDVKSGSSV